MDRIVDMTQADEALAALDAALEIAELRFQNAVAPHWAVLNSSSPESWAAYDAATAPAQAELDEARGLAFSAYYAAIDDASAAKEAEAAEAAEAKLRKGARRSGARS